VWGGVAGDEMYDMLRGQWYAPRTVVARSLGHSHILPPAMRNPVGAFGVLNRLTQKAAMRLRKQGFYATSMSVHVRCDHRYRTPHAETTGGQRDTRFGETQDTAVFLHALDEFWRSGLGQLQHPKGVGMVLGGLVPVAMHTPSLFDQAAALPWGATSATLATPIVPTTASLQNAKVVRDRSRLFAAMDAINKTQGKNALYFATAHNALNNAPMRIAFNRIPDIETER
jgi:DNA polymerase IV